MDKICSGSLIGEVHNQGYRIAGAKSDEAKGRGTHISTRRATMGKLDNTVSPRSGYRSPRQRSPSDTFRTTSSWFRHDGVEDYACPASPRNNVNQTHLSSKFWKEASGHGAAPSPRERPRCESRDDFNPAPRTLNKAKTLSEMRTEIADDDAPAGRRMAAQKNNRSMGALPISPRAAPQQKQEAATSRSPRRMSATYRESENWMGYSSPGQSPAPEKRDDFRSGLAMGSLAPTSKRASCSAGIFAVKRQFSGRNSELSEDWFEDRRPDDEDVPPIITNSVNYTPSLGIKTHIAKESRNAYRLLQQDPTQPEPHNPERKHAFPEHPQSLKQAEQLNQLSPRDSWKQISSRRPTRALSADACYPSDDAHAYQPDRGKPSAAGIVDMQHRTTAEMVAVMTTAEAESSVPYRPQSFSNHSSAGIDQQKYMVGGEVVSWSGGGRRAANTCFNHSERLATQAAGVHTVPASPAVHLRDHRNSDLVREHLQPAPSCITRSPPNLALGQVQAPRATIPWTTFSAPNNPRTWCQVGGVSNLPVYQPLGGSMWGSGTRGSRHFPGVPDARPCMA